MRLVSFSDVAVEQWNACCDSSSQAWLYHRAEWIGIEAKHFVAENHTFAVMSAERILALQPLYFMEVGLGSWSEKTVHSGFHRHTGLALSPNLRHSEVKAVRSVVMQRIEQVAAKVDADRIQLNVQNLTPESFTLERQEIPFWIHGYGYRLGLNFSPMGVAPFPGMATCCADQVVSLSGEEDQLFGSLDEACRRAIRKAMAAELDVSVVTACSTETLDSYYQLALASAARTGESLAPKGYFEDLFGTLGRQGKLAIVFVVLNGDYVAAVLLGLDKDAASYLGGISNPDFLHLRVNDFAHWSAIRWAKSAGFSWYRLGPIFPEMPPDWPISKVSRFKAKFGGRSFSVIQGSKFLKPEKYRALTNDPMAP